MHRVIIFLRILILTISFSALVSCSFLQKMKDKMQGRNQIEGEGAGDISNIDIDSGSRGSDTGSINGLSTVFFSLDASHLSAEMKKTLKDNKDWFDNNSKVKRIELEGHCDPLGSEAYNIGLGQRRAEKVLSYLKSIGVKDSMMSIISYGEEKPLSQTDNALNRRVNFVPIY